MALELLEQESLLQESLALQEPLEQESPAQMLVLLRDHLQLHPVPKEPFPAALREALQQRKSARSAHLEPTNWLH